MTGPMPAQAVSEEHPPAGPRERDRHVDLVRAAALIRVIVYHATGNWILLTVLPAMPVMFFLGGTYLARSLRRRPFGEVLTGRVRRIAVPAAVYVMAVTVGLLAFSHPLRDVLVAVGQSIVPTHGGDGTGDSTADWLFFTLWYLRDYVVFALASPLLMRTMRAWPRAFRAAIAALLLIGAVSGIADATATYLGFWMLGMSGALAAWVDEVRRSDRRATIARLVVGAGVLGALLVLLPDPLGTTGVVVTGLAWLVGIELWSDRLSRVAERPAVSLAVAWLTPRAVSVYLWQMIPIVLCFAVSGTDDRTFAQAIDPLWIVPVSVLGALALAWALFPVERWAAGGHLIAGWPGIRRRAAASRPA